MAVTLDSFLSGFSKQFEAINEIQLVVSLLVLVVYAWTKFNTWPEAKKGKKDSPASPNPPNPPRDYTTFMQYSCYAIVYMLALQFIYLIILITPGLYKVILTQTSTSLPLDAENMPLWVLIFLTTILPATPGLREIELSLRRKLHGLALIPAGARSYIEDLKENPARFMVKIKDEDKKEKLLLAEVQQEVMSDEDLLRPDKRLKHRWFRLRYLCMKISNWKIKPRINSYANHCGAELNICDQRMKELTREVKNYYQRLNEAKADGQITPIEQEFLNRLRSSLESSLDSMLLQAYQFICCGIFATEKTETGRWQTFNYFGFAPDKKKVPPVLVDVIIVCVAAVSLATFLASYVYLSLGEPQQLSKAPSWTIVMLLLQGSSITLAILLSRRIIRRKSRSEEKTIETDKVSYVAMGAFFGYLPGFAIILCYVLIGPSNSGGIVDNALRILPWPLIPAATAAFVVYYLVSLEQKKKAKMWQEATTQAFVSALIGALAYVIYFSREVAEPNTAFLVYICVVCFFTGGIIGAIFPGPYRRRFAGTHLTKESRSEPRVELIANGMLLVAGIKIAVQILNLSLNGARLDFSSPLAMGSDVSLGIPGLGFLDAKVKNQQEGTTSLRFESLDETQRDNLRDYLE